LLVKSIFYLKGNFNEKTLIALAIAAAMPVAAQADVTIFRRLTSKYKNTGAIDTCTRLSIAFSEVLANGMTATASFAILLTLKNRV
jgi:predicted porin